MLCILLIACPKSFGQAENGMVNYAPIEGFIGRLKQKSGRVIRKNRACSELAWTTLRKAGCTWYAGYSKVVWDRSGQWDMVKISVHKTHSPCFNDKKGYCSCCSVQVWRGEHCKFKRSVAAFLLSWCGLLAEQRLRIERRGNGRSWCCKGLTTFGGEWWGRETGWKDPIF